MKRAIGKNTVGGGKRMDIKLKNYERSTHDKSFVFRSTMAAGTLVPFLKEVGLPGDTWDIDLEASVLTHPTIGPLFGSFKVQLDIFTADVRLYQGRLHNNALNVGMNMAQIKLPRIALGSNALDFTKPLNNQQINPSSIFKYLGISGLGTREVGGVQQTTIRYFNAVPYLMYADVYKNYYANKQETNGQIIHASEVAQSIDQIDILSDGLSAILPRPPAPTINFTMKADGFGVIYFTGTVPNPATVEITYTIDVLGVPVVRTSLLTEMFNTVTTGSSAINFSSIKTEFYNTIWHSYMYVQPDSAPARIFSFPLANIDLMRENILTATKVATPFTINVSTIAPYGLPMETINGVRAMTTSQEGLFLKTYQSDVFNNWVKTEWISGANSINELTAVSTVGNSFTIDTLTMKRKVYNMMNAVAISGGSYDDWMDVQYAENRYAKPESPVYHGGLSKELIFQEVVSNSATQAEGGQPLGTLAGRGVLGKKHKGGYVRVKPSEICYIMGIVSITPRIDYSQGNDWDMNLDNMDDFHKPALDGIGFQDLTTDTMAWWDTPVNTAGVPTYRTAGKQPAWLWYMTNYNRVFGNFAIESEQMFMTLNRRYERNPVNGRILDLTSYVDPQKYNHIFAYTARDAQNFWVQIGVNATARRKMSAKLMPQG